MGKITLFKLYEDAEENAAMNDINIDVTYLQEYASNAYEKRYNLTQEKAILILKCHNDYEKSEKGENNRYYLIEKILDDILLN